MEVLACRGSDEKSILVFHLAALKTMQIKIVYLRQEEKGKKKKKKSMCTVPEVQLVNMSWCLCCFWEGSRMDNCVGKVVMGKFS